MFLPHVDLQAHVSEYAVSFDKNPLCRTYNNIYNLYNSTSLAPFPKCCDKAICSLCLMASPYNKGNPTEMACSAEIVIIRNIIGYKGEHIHVPGITPYTEARLSTAVLYNTAL
jgi:hypothetical protein